jgi:hypothetical protein
MEKLKDYLLKEWNLLIEEEFLVLLKPNCIKICLLCLSIKAIQIAKKLIKPVLKHLKILILFFIAVENFFRLVLLAFD